MYFTLIKNVLKSNPVFCDARFCSPKVNGLYMYEDNDHLSVDGSRYVAPMLQTAISNALRD